MKAFPALVVVLLSAVGCHGKARERSKARESEGGSTLVVTIVYDNNPFDERLRAAWGFACVVEGLSETVLFDTGGDGGILLANMAKAGFKPGQIDSVVLSHIHGDHTGGLEALLRANSGVKVFVPRAFPSRFKEGIRRSGAQVVETDEPCQVCEGAWTTGVLTRGIAEQGLYPETADGPVVITGCAHPGIVRLVEAARRHAKEPVYAVLGGFHMGGASAREIATVIQSLRKAGVRQVAPCHCSGDRTRSLMKRAFGEEYLPSGVGARLVFGSPEPEEEP
ncbi:MAG: MBL fold metallo-hydrolase [bacterium]